MVRLVGTVVASDWDEEGNVLAIDLETSDETYLIDLSGTGQELLSHVGRIVEVVGEVEEDEDGWTHILVSSFTVIPDPS